MKLIDQQYLVTPFYGSRRMKVWLDRQGRQKDLAPIFGGSSAS
jgi:hypothetical protein